MPSLGSGVELREIFWFLYTTLDNLSEYHKLEKHAEREINYYQTIKGDSLMVKRWVGKCKNLYKKSLWFRIDFMNNLTELQTLTDDINYINISAKDFVVFKIRIKSKEFGNIIAFYRLISNLENKNSIPTVLYDYEKDPVHRKNEIAYVFQHTLHCRMYSISIRKKSEPNSYSYCACLV